MKFHSLESFLVYLLPRLTPRRIARAVARRLRALFAKPTPAPEPGQISFLRLLSPLENRAKVMATVAIDGQFDIRFPLTSQDYVIQKGENETFIGCDVVLLAHWDPDNVVDPYVCHLARHFKELGKKVVLCSAAPLSEPAKNTAPFDAVVCRTCPGYDMTSWKACFAAFPSLFDANETTLTNDSCFGPIGSFAPIYETMGHIPCDFWGLTLNREFFPHLQSFFLVFRQSALKHLAFHDFLDAIPLESDRESMIHIETLLSLWLELRGLQGGCFRPYNQSGPVRPNPMTSSWRRALNDGVPLLKRELLKLAGHIVAMPCWEHRIQPFEYNTQFILEHFYRIGIDISPALCPGKKRSKTFPPSILARELKFDEISISSSQEIYKPDNIDIAVFIHCFYPHLLTDIAQKLCCLPRQAKIFLSTDSEKKKSEITGILRECGLHADICVFSNRGWDIGPFLAGFGKEITEHELVLKMHVKGSTNMNTEAANRWRELLYNSLLGSKEHVDDIINLFVSNPRLGMLAPPSLAIARIDAANNAEHFYPLAKKMGLDMPRTEAVDFPMGSMFWARGNALRPLVELGLTLDDFEKTNHLKRDGSLAHAVERLFLLSACLEGYSWGRIAPAPYGFLGAPRIDR